MTKVRTPEPEMFADFWTIWQPVSRHTDGRGLARETFRKHVLNGVEPQDIVDGARWFVRSLSDRDRDFVPLSSTWLNREAFLDICDKERAYQARLAEMEQRKDNVVQISAQPVGQTKFLREYEARKRGNA